MRWNILRMVFTLWLLHLSLHIGAIDIQEEAFFNKYDKDKDGSLVLEEYKKLLKDQWHGLSDPDAPAHQAPWSDEDRDEIYKMQDHFMVEDWNKDTVISWAEFAATSTQLASQSGNAHRWPGIVEMVVSPENAIDDGGRSEDEDLDADLDIDLEDGIIDSDEFEPEEEEEEEEEEDAADESDQSCQSNLAHEEEEPEEEMDEQDLLANAEEALFTMYDKNKDGNLDLEEYKKLLKDEWHGASDLDAPAHEAPWSEEDRDEIYKMQDHFMAEDWDKDTLISRAEFASVSMELAGREEPAHRWPGHVSPADGEAEAEAEAVDPDEDEDETDVTDDIDLEEGIVDDEFDDEDENEDIVTASDARKTVAPSNGVAVTDGWFGTYDKDKDGNLDLEEYKKLLKDEWHGASDLDAPAHEAPWSEEDRDEIYKMQDHFMAEDWDKDTVISYPEFVAASARLAAQSIPYRRAGVSN